MGSCRDHGNGNYSLGFRGVEYRGYIGIMDNGNYSLGFIGV